MEGVFYFQPEEQQAWWSDTDDEECEIDWSSEDAVDTFDLLAPTSGRSDRKNSLDVNWAPTLRTQESEEGIEICARLPGVSIFSRVFLLGAKLIPV